MGSKRYGPETLETIHYCSTERHIHHELDPWMRNFNATVEYAVNRMNIGI
jgi:hypothetical protein